MTRFKISSDPYKSLITYQKWDSLDETWRNFAYSDNKKSSLFKGKLSLAYFPFKAKEILDIIYSEFCVKGETLEVVFEGTDDEYDDFYDDDVWRKKYGNDESIDDENDDGRQRIW